MENISWMMYGDGVLVKSVWTGQWHDPLQREEQETHISLSVDQGYQNI
jgi:hypothetical protein